MITTGAAAAPPPGRREHRSPAARAAALAALLLAGPAGSAPGAAPEPDARDRPRLDPGDPYAEPVAHAVAVLHPSAGHATRGVVRLRHTTAGVAVTTRVSGLAPGSRHAYHVHLFGDCSAADAGSAGTHFNFRGRSRRPPETVTRITGNLGDLAADASGVASASAMIAHARLNGPGNVIGRAIVVHARPNDPAQPPIGAAGARIACGTIGIADDPAADSSGPGRSGTAKPR
ncbi:MAG: superoxide dismutase family protein [Gammaproteobacteria bacterium]